MRHLALAFSLFAAGVAASAHAHQRPLHTSCSVTTDFDVDVQTDRILFTRTDDAPRQVVMHDGQLQVDGHALKVDPADAARLRQYEAQVRALLPEMTGIAREGVGIGFEALTTVAATFADSPAERARLIEQFTTQREHVLAEVDQGIGRGQWRRHGLDRMMEHDIGNAVSTMVGTVTARAVRAALSGDESQAAALEARADSLEESIDRAVKAPAERLEKRADALCPRLAELDQLQHQFTFRLPDGTPLSLITVEQEHKDTLADTHTP